MLLAASRHLRSDARGTRCKVRTADATGDMVDPSLMASEQAFKSSSPHSVSALAVMHRTKDLQLVHIFPESNIPLTKSNRGQSALKSDQWMSTTQASSKSGW